MGIRHEPFLECLPYGYYILLMCWVETPTEWLSMRQVESRCSISVCGHLARMHKMGLLEEKYLSYRPTRGGWLAAHDYECNHLPEEERMIL